MSWILTSSAGEVLLDESYPECKACIAQGKEIIEKCPIDKKKRARHTRMFLKGGTAFDCNKKHGFVASKSMHEKMIATTSDVLEHLATYRNAIQGEI